MAGLVNIAESNDPTPETSEVFEFLWGPGLHKPVQGGVETYLPPSTLGQVRDYNWVSQASVARRKPRARFQCSFDLLGNELAGIPSTDWRALRYWRFGGISAVGTASTSHHGVPSGTGVLDDEVWRVVCKDTWVEPLGERKDALYPKNGRAE